MQLSVGTELLSCLFCKFYTFQAATSPGSNSTSQGMANSNRDLRGECGGSCCCSCTCSGGKEVFNPWPCHSAASDVRLKSLRNATSLFFKEHNKCTPDSCISIWGFSLEAKRFFIFIVLKWNFIVAEEWAGSENSAVKEG